MLKIPTQDELHQALCDALSSSYDETAEKFIRVLISSPAMLGVVDASMEPLDDISRRKLVANGLLTAFMMGMALERNRTQQQWTIPPGAKPC